MSWTSGFRAARRAGSDPPTGAPVAAVRAGVFALVSTGLAVTGHHLASGHPVPWRSVPVALCLLFLLTMPAVRRPRSLPAVVSATGAAQASLHFWLARAGGHRATDPHMMTDHGAPLDAHEVWHSGHHGTSMTAAHIAAALLVAWCLQRADAACRAAGERLGDVIVELLVRLVPAGVPPAVPRVLRPVRARAQSPPHNSLVLAHAVVRRGPPAEVVPAT
ncbi:hypothetical protein [Streptomyces sp. NPDC051662]|uniref:hypothetical protein n=1 Tax=Streptomyces sp. NPDC051662 TaxID=3154750 RepID=UPI00342A40FA